MCPSQGQADRVNYLMTKQAKIVAMTCTHAALKRREFLELGFKFDNLLMEESAQILEIETFIPMLLQVGLCLPVCSLREISVLKCGVRCTVHGGKTADIDKLIVRSSSISGGIVAPDHMKVHL